MTTLVDVIVVLDIGKSNLKLSVVELSSGERLITRTAENRVVNSGAYPHADIEGIWQWYCDSLQALTSDYYVRYLGCTTHGATAVCLSGEEVAFPVVDYEVDHYEKINTAYSATRPDYQTTFSPELLGSGLNIGRQLYWLQHTFPETFSTVDNILMYPQYWGWRLSGRACSEVTSLGCHTDLWSPLQNTYSSLVTTSGWQHLFPPLLAAGTTLGLVLPELSQALGLPADCQVLNGIHDSNASLIPYLHNNSVPFTVISSGTWVIMAGVGLPLRGLSERDDMLVNVNAYGESVPCIRFMGGREWELLRNADECDLHDLDGVLEKAVYVLPSLTPYGGPFRNMESSIVGPFQELSPREQTALASLYCALLSDYCLSRLGSQGDMYLEGSFAQNVVYQAALQWLRPQQELKVSTDMTGTTQGVTLLIPNHDASYSLTTVEPTMDQFSSGKATISRCSQLKAYKLHWQKQVERAQLQQ